MSKKKKGPTARVFSMFWGYGKGYFISFTLQNAFDKIIPFFDLWISAAIITALYEGSKQSEVSKLIIIALAGNLLARILSAIFQYFVNTQKRVMENNEKRAFNDKVLSLDYDKLENPELRTLRRKIETNSYINSYGPKNMIFTIEEIIRCVLKVLYSTILFTEMFCSIIQADFRPQSLLFFVLIVVGLAIHIIWDSAINKKMAKYWRDSGDILLEGNKLGSAKPNNEKDIRIYQMLSYVEACGDKYNDEYKRVMINTNLGIFKLTIPGNFIKIIPQCFSYLLVCFYCGMGVFPIGGVIKYVGYLDKFMEGAGGAIRRFADFKVNRPFLETYLEFFDIVNDMYQGSLSVEKRSDKQFEVEFKNVSFKYPESDSYALQNINFKFEVGKKLAVVGMNGSGKTTLIKLLCRLYDPTDGEIIMNDFNVRKYDYKQYLDIFSVVFQDYNLLSFSLGQNVAANGTFDGEKAEQYLREVGFGDRLDELPNKLNTALYKDFDDEGVEISGGEAQKIALARALYKDAPFIILDEPTAALDPLSEAEIYSRFDDIVGDKSAIYISHRLSSCRFCDKILVLDEGKIVQFGSHEELLTDKAGKYHELWTAQAQYYVPVS